MGDIVVEFLFRTTLDQKEFSLITRALAGHELKPHDLILARELNKRLIQQRVAQLRAYLKAAENAVQVAEEEFPTEKQKKVILDA